MPAKMSDARMGELLQNKPSCDSIRDLITRFVNLSNHQQAYYVRRVKNAIVCLLRTRAVDLHSLECKQALHIAVESKKYVLARVLIEAGCDLEHKNNYNQTILHIATLKHASKFVSYLLTRGADIESLCNGRTVLALAARCGYLDIVQLLLNAGANMYGGYSLPLTGSACDRPDIISAFIDAGFDANRQSNYGSRPLHYAGSEECVKVFIGAGAVVDCVDEFGISPLMRACMGTKFNENGAVKMLLIAGADTNLVDRNGKTALHFTLDNFFDYDSYVDRCLWLIAGDIDVNYVDERFANSLSPFHYFLAAIQSFLETVVEDPGDLRWKKIFYLFIAAGASAVAHNLYNQLNADRSTFGAERIAFWIDKITKRRAELDSCRFNFIKKRAAQICTALQDLYLPALVTLAIVNFSCDPMENISMFRKWNLITGVKHFRR
jgi:ankyrin repeat protein